MNKLRPSLPTVMFAITIVLALPTSALAQVRVLMSGGFRAAYQELLPQFEKTTGITVTTAAGPSQGDGPNTIAAQLRRGVPADVVIMSREGMAELFKDGRIAHRLRRRSRSGLVGSWCACRNAPARYRDRGRFQKDRASREIHRHSKHVRYLPEDNGISEARDRRRDGGEALERGGGQCSERRSGDGHSARK